MANRDIIEINNEQDLINLFIIKSYTLNGYSYNSVEINNKIININDDFEFNYTSDTITDTNFPSEINLINTIINGNGKKFKNLVVKKTGQKYKSLFNSIDKDSIVDNLIFDNLSGFFSSNNKGIIINCSFKNMKKIFPFNENKYSFIIDGINEGTIIDCSFSNIEFDIDNDNSKVIPDNNYNGISVICNINNGTINKCSFENIKIKSNKASLITFINKKNVLNCIIKGDNYITNTYDGVLNSIMIGGLVGVLDGGVLQNIDIKGNIIINNDNYGLLCNSIINKGTISCITINYLNKNQLVNINAKEEFENKIDNVKRIQNIFINDNFKYIPFNNIELNKRTSIKVIFNDKDCNLNKKNTVVYMFIIITIFILIILFLLYILFKFVNL